jgi:hypothetical protein
MIMSSDLIRALSLSALLLGCAHREETRSSSEHNSEAVARAGGEETPHYAATEPDRDEPARAADDREARRTEPREPAGGGVNEPARNEPERARTAATDEGTELSPLDQGSSEIDIDLTQRIRKALMDDDTLSFKAKNAKVITRDGHVTLRGAVKTPAEKAAIGKAAVAVAGVARVTNQLEVRE